MLKEIITRYEANCDKCQRGIQPKWKAFFQATPTKKIFCKSCGEKMNKEEAEEVKPDVPAVIDSQMQRFIDNLDYITVGIDSLAKRIEAQDYMLGLIQTNTLEIYKRVAEEKPEKQKKSTKK